MPVLMTFEETADDVRKNVTCLGFDVASLIACKKLLINRIQVSRGEIDENGEYDLERLFIRLGHAVESIGAKRVVLDTIETLFSGFSNEGILRSELRRLFGWLKERNLTTGFFRTSSIDLGACQDSFIPPDVVDLRSASATCKTSYIGGTLSIIAAWIYIPSFGSELRTKAA